MTEANTQTVVETTEAPVTPAAEVNGAQTSDLESFLAEYDAKTKPAQTITPQTQPVTADPVVLQLKSELDSFRQERAAEKNDADLSTLVRTVKGDLEIPEYVVKGWIDEKVAADKSGNSTRIFNDRQNDPTAYNRLVKSFTSDFSKEELAKAFGKKIDAEATGDRAAVAAAVRGSSTRAPESAPPNFGKMNNSEFNDWVVQNKGFHPGV